MGLQNVGLPSLQSQEPNAFLLLGIPQRQGLHSSSTGWTNPGSLKAFVHGAKTLLFQKQKKSGMTQSVLKNILKIFGLEAHLFCLAMGQSLLY